jgi:peptidoglycan hydrolase CwlO-like protein
MSETNLTRDHEELLEEVEKIRTQIDRTASKFKNLQQELAELRVQIAKLHKILHP